MSDIYFAYKINYHIIAFSDKVNNMSEIVTISVNQESVSKIRDFYADYQVNNSGEYIEFQAKIRGLVITVYSSKKQSYKVVFVGEDALKEARAWDVNATPITPKEKVKETKNIDLELEQKFLGNM